MLNVTLAAPARRDIDGAYAWWRDRRSASQAERWYEQILQSIEALSETADSCPPSPEADLYPEDLRELHFGIGRRPTHRIVFAIAKRQVTVLRVRHVAQRPLDENDLGVG
jgi:plasmid stabilization system protein ParE